MTPVSIKNWPRHIPTTWRDRGTLRHLVLVVRKEAAKQRDNTLSQGTQQQRES